MGVALLLGCVEDKDKAKGTGTLFRCHFAGRAALSQGTNATRLKAVDTLPATAELRQWMAQKLARAAFEFWKGDLPAGTAEKTTLLQPLFNDLMLTESCVEVRGPIGKTETMVAIELSDERARLWSTNLWQVVTAWKFGPPRPVAAEGANGWEARRAQAPNSFQFARVGQWVLVGLGQHELGVVQSLARRAATRSRPMPALTNDFLDVKVDTTALSVWFPWFARYSLPPAHLTMVGHGDNVRSEIRLDYSNKMLGPLEPWRIPTNLVTEPLTSFTVARGIAPLLERVQGFSELGLRPIPNQLCAWGISNEQPRLFFTMPVTDATNAIRQLAPTAPRFLLERFTNGLGSFLYISNRAELVWTLPLIAPYLRAAKDAGSEFIFGGIFPPFSRTFPVPDELYAQVRGRTNLTYYDWEDTPQRLEHGRYLFQLAALVDQRSLPATNSVSQRWLAAIRDKLGNTVTEITQTGPQELTLVRKSQVGLTGFELAAFSAWLESRGFPFRLELPPPMRHHHTNAAPRPASPR